MKPCIYMICFLELETSTKSNMCFPIRNKEPIRLARLPDAHLPDKNVERDSWSLQTGVFTMNYWDHFAIASSRLYLKSCGIVLSSF